MIEPIQYPWVVLENGKFRWCKAWNTMQEVWKDREGAENYCSKHPEFRPVPMPITGSM